MGIGLGGCHVGQRFSRRAQGIVCPQTVDMCVRTVPPCALGLMAEALKVAVVVAVVLGAGG